MSCRPTPVDSCRNVSRRPWGKPDDPNFQIPGTMETGRLHFFYHCPDSPLPVRDILGRQYKGCKTEPHLEKCAENYCWACDPMNIWGLLKTEEKYLFLYTTCKFKDARYYDKRFIVGYIEKQEALFCKGHGERWWSVLGFTKLVSFGHAYSLDRSVGGPFHRVIRHRKLDERQTTKVLAKLKNGRNILRECKDEIKKLLARGVGDL